MTGNSPTPTWQDVVAGAGLQIRGRCGVCALDPEIQANLAAGYAAGHRQSFYKAYLAACGIEGVTSTMVRNHFERGHHERA